jgi:hypothetical protein
VKRAIVRTAVVLAVLSLPIYFATPPARLILRGAADDGTIAGVLHVHTNRSDGRSSPDEIAEAAARVGLKFLVFTDHGDGTRQPDAPTYRSGVLCIDAVEISTTGGHYIALGMEPAPYPLGGEPRAVVEDVRRLGGFGIAAHPDSPRSELEWTDWDPPVDGLEIVNLDTGWRAHLAQPGFRPKLRLLGALGSYPFQPEETIAKVFADPSAIIERWQALAEQRPVVGVAGVDAHAKLALWDVEPGDNRFTLPFPGYAPSFRTLSVHVQPDWPLTGDAPSDAEAVLQAIRGGRLYVAIDAIATPPSFEFSASAGGKVVQQGSELPADGHVRLRVRSNAPREFTTTVWDGRRMLTTGRREEDFTILVPQGPGVYRVEIRASNRPREPLWIVSNPIYVRSTTTAATNDSRLELPSPAGSEIPAAADSLLFPAAPFGWTAESDAASRSSVQVLDGELEFRFTLGSDRDSHPSVALAAPPHALLPNDHVTFRIRSDRPMRLSVQLRTGASGSNEERWQRSIYVDPVERDVTVFFDAVRPVGATRTEHPPLANTPSLVLVVDSTNTRAGASGAFWVSRAALGRSDTSSQAGRR